MRRYALVTGASRGIGYAIAKYFASRGSNLILLAQHADGLNQARASIAKLYPECQIESFPVDMKAPHMVAEIVEEIVQKRGPISILVNCAGQLTLGTSTVSAEEIVALLNVNLASSLIISNKVAGLMRAQGEGHIFNIASLAGVENKPKLGIYAASKAGLISYSEALYNELLPFNINVSCLCPGVVNTDMTNDGRIDNEEKIQVGDVVSAVDFILSFGNSVAMPRLDMHCKIIDLSG